MDGDNFEDLFGASDEGSPEKDDNVEKDITAEEKKGDDDEGEVSKEVLEKLKNLRAKARKPQPKLDENRLIDKKRGLDALLRTFEGVSFQGNGHEVDDLTLLMTKLEHWAHRLFPKMTFDEVLARCEKLGSKRAVQTHIRRIRLGEVEPIEDDTAEDTQPQDPIGIDGDDIPAVPTDNGILADDEDIFEKQINDLPDNEDNAENPGFELVQNTPIVELSAEVLADIERNRQAALKRRQEFLARQQEDTANKLPRIDDGSPELATVRRLPVVVEYEKELEERNLGSSGLVAMDTGASFEGAFQSLEESASDVLGKDGLGNDFIEIRPIS